MAMQATIKCNQKTKDQARKVLAALRNSFTSAQLGVVLEEIDYVPNPLRSMDLVFQDVKSSSKSNQLEIILLDWMAWSVEETFFRIFGNTMLCNLVSKSDASLKLEKVVQESVNLLVSLKAKAFAKIPEFTSSIIEDHADFYLASKMALASLYKAFESKHQDFQQYLIVNGNHEVLVQVNEFNAIKIPLRRGWETALFLFILKNKNGFSFSDFRIKQDASQLAYFYSLTKPNTEEFDTEREIRYRIENDQFGDLLSPHFSRIRDAVAMSLGKYPELLEQLTISKRGPVKNINWDRSAIVWK